MPLYAFQCLNGHREDLYHARAGDLGCRTAICEACGSSMAVVLSVGRGLTWCSESRPCAIENLGHDPVVVRSPEEHRRRMREAGVEWATRGRGQPGQWS